MKGLIIHERIILESLSKTPLDFQSLQKKTGLQEDMSFRIIQGLIIKGLIQNEGGKLSLCQKISDEELNQLNGPEARKLESLEFIEKIVRHGPGKDFKIARFALTRHDEKIFRAMIYNLESFLKDCHQKNKKGIPVKEQTLVFYGLGSVETLMQ